MNPPASLRSDHRSLSPIQVVIFTEIGTQRSDGSKSRVVRRQVVRDGEAQLLREFANIADHQKRVQIGIDYATKSVTTVNFPESASTANPISQCSPGTLEDTTDAEEILGYQVLRINRRVDRGPPQVVVEQWIARGLACYPLRQRWTKVSSGSNTGPVNTYDVIAVIPGEPNQQLFTVPEGYVERPPSEVVRLQLELHGDTECPTCLSDQLRNADARYLARRPQTPEDH